MGAIARVHVPASLLGLIDLYVTEVWVEQNGGWQMVSRQATKLTQ